ncbi:PREDICTED: tyrosine--tRNA ligase, mitochondrial [Dufourea novaeangliae]|uniref:Tyrosine--tRNA ligase n=1 Tax=Dufourea novaeangliae TaxID=178035 RepID=A0A154NXY0_DUFNO|nr:PREDICTED: tyrosine--tRNA ligase, mitochondrial [Dufourea novaeangliae]KZC04473.1 putative tyrosine--tRNA ligase, mitochondrial [Dufourea novaeangliae]
MNSLVRLCSFTRHLNARRLHTAKYVLDADNRQLYEDIFPDIYLDTIKKLWRKPPQCVYAGFDPTAESLHIGNLLVLINLLHWQRCGHQVIILLGGATGLIGDPSFRNSERVEIENIVLNENLQSINNNIKKIFRNHERHFCKKLQHDLRPVTILNNLDWYNNKNIISFIRDVGKYFRMGTMLGRSSVQSRLQSDTGMSFTEFSYPLFQGYDWLHLQRTYNCSFQVGGQDQMGNIMTGYDLVTKYLDKQVYGLTLPLVTTEGGKKLGKSVGNAVWLSSSKSSSFQLYQYFVRTEDADVEKFLHFFTFIPLHRIREIVEDHFRNPELRRAQKILAEQVTLLIHGDEGLVAAKRASAILYEKSIDSLSRINADELSQLLDGATIVDLLPEPSLTVYELAMRANCFKWESDARRIIAAGGFSINYQKITNTEEVLVPGIHIMRNNVTLVRVGKKNYYVIRWT